MPKKSKVMGSLGKGVFCRFQLPDATVAGLHTVTQHIYSYDYPNCLVTINGLVQTGSFTVLSEFLPGIKVLVQVATQLSVYLTK